MVRTGNLFPARLRVSHQDKRQNTKFRRNGKLQACEPCRKAKMRCDHMTPTCGRCARRRKVDQCVYHPAPLTKTASIPTPQHTNSNHSSPGSNSLSALFGEHSDCATTRTTTISDSARARRNELPQPLPSLVQLADYNSTSTPAVLSSPFSGISYPRVSRASSVPVQPGMQGQQPTEECRGPLSDYHIRDDALSFDKSAAFTNDFAVLAENELSIGIQPANVDSVPASNISQSHIDRGATVLTVLKDFPAIQNYIAKLYSFAGGFVVIEPMVKIYTSGLWSTWHRTLEAQKPADLRLMSAKIWENTLRPISCRLNKNTTPQEFCTNVTGEHLRWEIVGIIVTLVSLLVQSLKDGDPIFCTQDEPPVDRAALALKMHNASEMCVSFCDDFGVLNDLYLWLLYENSIIYYSMRTRATYENSRKVAALASALLCCNLHQEIKVDEHTPFFITEFRKRLFICSYANDKRFATSAGRPPKLTRHYCRLQPPLDLTDAQTMSEGMDLETALGDLDGEGWNQRDMVQPCTFARLSATNALITEEILEISLGHLSREEIIQRAGEIEAKADKSWEELPNFLRVDTNELWNLRRSPIEILWLVWVRLGHLEHLFLLQRTLSKQAGSGPNSPNINLLSICEELFQFVLLIVANKDYFRDFQLDFVHMLAVHGVPTAAILAVELLHQEQNPTAPSAITYPLHRSETIQNLSVFVSCLGTITTGSNGSQSCDRGRKFLKTILDMILGPGPAAPITSPSNVTIDSLSDPMLGAPLLQAGSDGDFVRWLESMEWDQDSWINFN